MNACKVSTRPRKRWVQHTLLDVAGAVLLEFGGFFHAFNQGTAMKVLSSLKSAKTRHRDCKIVRRRGKVFVICKSNPRFKARQR